jgi:V8-like Glu-specific endopeptidase
MGAHAILSLENVVRHQPPPRALHNLKSANSFTVEGAAELGRIIQETGNANGMRSFQIRGDHKLIRGLPLRKIRRLKREEVKVASPTLPLPPPKVPEWADIIYHPKMSVRLARPTMRRSNGKRVRPLYIFGNDVRQPFCPTGYPWQCIGRIFAYNDPYSFTPSWMGTGVLVSHDIVLTASHVVPWGANPGMIQFVPAYFNGFSTLGPNVYSYVDEAAAYYQEPDPNVDKPAWDFAVLHLIDALGDSLGWFGGRTYDDSWNDGNYWNLVGYAGDIDGGEQPSWQGGISFHDDDEDGDAMELETDNGDATPGDSGGPFFAWWEGENYPSVVGVVSAQEREWDFPWWNGPEDNNVAAAGSPMIDLVLWARSNWG